MKINIEISIGELIDKISILKIKLEKIKEKPKFLNIKKEHDALIQKVKIIKGYQAWLKKILIVNKKLWAVEDKIREKERSKSFDQDFICLARKVYLLNDLRFKLKSKINIKFNSNIFEEKSYKKY